MDGTLIEAAASIKSFRPKEEAERPKKHGHGHGGSTPGNPRTGRNQDVNFRGERRSQ